MYKVCSDDPKVRVLLQDFDNDPTGKTLEQFIVDPLVEDGKDYRIIRDVREKKNVKSKR